MAQNRIRANWHLDHLFVDDGKDPLAVNEQATIEEIGKPIDLSTDTAQLRDELMLLFREEERLYNDGCSCEIKELASTCCTVCPLRGSQGRLCEVGVQQETLETTLAVAARGRQ